MNQDVRIRVLLGYHGGLHRQLLAAALSHEVDLAVVAELAGTDTVPALVRQLQPDVAILDLALPGNPTVIELCRTLTACRVLVVLDQRSGLGVVRSLVQLAPRVGLLEAEATPANLVTGVRRLARGEAVLDARLALAALQPEPDRLTDRERDILRLTRLGATAAEVGAKLCLSTGTVRNYISRIFTKTGARNRLEAIRIAQEAGWI